MGCSRLVVVLATRSSTDRCTRALYICRTHPEPTGTFWQRMFVSITAFLWLRTHVVDWCWVTTHLLYWCWFNADPLKANIRLFCLLFPFQEKNYAFFTSILSQRGPSENEHSFAVRPKFCFEAPAAPWLPKWHILGPISSQYRWKRELDRIATLKPLWARELVGLDEMQRHLYQLNWVDEATFWCTTDPLSTKFSWWRHHPAHCEASLSTRFTW